MKADFRNVDFNEHRMFTLLNYVVKLQVLQGSDSFRAMFTVWLDCMTWLGLLKGKDINICCLMVLS